MRKFLSLLSVFGISPAIFIRGFKNLPIYLKNYKEYRSLADDNCFKIGKLYPCLHDREDSCGNFESYYFSQDLYVAQQIFKNNPRKHVDVGSRVDGFVSNVASFRSIDVVDIRAFNGSIENITFHKIDFMRPLILHYQSFCDSLSCLHALEHFGLGRYGDPVCVNGHLEGFKNLTMVLEPGGTLYLSVPVGPQRVEFDAHRVFSIKYLIELFSDHFEIQNFALVNDAGEFKQSVMLTPEIVSSNAGCNFGCGIFTLKKHSL